MAEEQVRPSQTDYYLMQVALKITRLPFLVWGQKPPDLKLSDMKLVPDTTARRPTAQRREQSIDDNKAIWGAILGLKIPKSGSAAKSQE